jgi:NitT/TauT family transport system substrate-binding protein
VPHPSTFLDAAAAAELNSQPAPERLSRRQALGWALGAALAAPLAGCAPPLPPLRVGSIVFPGYELMFLAREMGLLAPAEVRLIEMRSNTDVLRALGAGQLEAAALTLDELLSARADGVDLRVALVLDVSEGSDVVLGRPGIRQAADLKGRRIGVEDSAGGAVMLGALLDATGLSVEQIHKVPITLDRSIEFYASGQLDAVVTAEPWAGTLEAQGAHRLFDSSAIPGMIVDVLVVRADAVDRQLTALRHLVSAQFEALAAFRQSPEQVAPQLAPRLQLAPANVKAAFRGLKLPDAAQNRAWLQPGGQLQQSAESLMKVMVKQSLLKQAIDLHLLSDARGLGKL